MKIDSHGGFLARVFVLEFRVNLSADDEDLQTHPQSSRECVGVFLRLRFRVAPDGIRRSFEFDQEMLFEVVPGEEPAIGNDE